MAAFGIRSYNTDALEIRGPASTTTDEVAALYDAVAGWTLKTNNTNALIIDGSQNASFKGDVTLTSGVAVFDSYTVATVPTASAYPGGAIYVTNETNGATVAVSNGTNWVQVYSQTTIA